MPDLDIDDASFSKQRRNLIFISLFAIFYKIGNLKLEEINILGNHTTIGNPEIISTFLWIFFFYFLWRYYTACNKVHGVYKFKSSIKALVHDMCSKEARKLYAKAANCLPKQLSVALATHRNGKKTSKNTFYISTYSSSLSAKEEESLKKIGRIHIEGVRLFKIRCRAIILNIVNKDEFSEYLLPYMLAALGITELLELGIITNSFELIVYIRYSFTNLYDWTLVSYSR